MHPKPASYLIVRVAGRLCALPVAQVVEVLRLPASLPVAGSSAALLGIIAWRGQQVAALELAALLALEAPRTPASSRRLVATKLGSESVDQIVALAVDEVVGIEPLAPGSLSRIALPGGAEQRRGGFDSGFARLLDASGMLADEVAAALEAV